jgi:hypothetical protein
MIDDLLPLWGNHRNKIHTTSRTAVRLRSHLEDD